MQKALFLASIARNIKKGTGSGILARSFVYIQKHLTWGSLEQKETFLSNHLKHMLKSNQLKDATYSVLEDIIHIVYTTNEDPQKNKSVFMILHKPEAWE